MKINITSKTAMTVPARFTMKDLADANPGVKYPTLNARVKALIKSGEVIEVATVKSDNGRGRAANVYALKSASLNPKDKNDPVYQAKKQGRFPAVVAEVKSDTATTDEATAVEASAETVEVPVEVVPSAEATA